MNRIVRTRPRPDPAAMWRFVAATILLMAAGLGPAPGAAAAPPSWEARVLKVLPHYLDRQGRHTINPSLFDRDAYQAELRRDPQLRSGMRFDVLWKSPPGSPAALTLKLELRGSRAPKQNPVLIEARAFARGGFSQWTRVPVAGEDYAALGDLLAWRVSLWRDGHLLAEQTSFLW